MISAPDYTPRSPVEPELEPRPVDKAWQTLRARAARCGLAVYRANSDDDEKIIFIVAAGGVRMLPDLGALEAAIEAAEREGEARRAPRLRPGLEWEPREVAT